jgi:hypothetical protein
VLLVLAGWQLRLLRALEVRGHAALTRIGAKEPDDIDPYTLADIVHAAQPARSHPEWESGVRLIWREAPQRQELVKQVAQSLQEAIERL